MLCGNVIPHVGANSYRTLEQLSKKVLAYEELLLQVAPQLDDDQRSAFERVLLLVRTPVLRKRLKTYLHSHLTLATVKTVTLESHRPSIAMAVIAVANL